jgi:hypothetical protein
MAGRPPRQHLCSTVMITALRDQDRTQHYWQRMPAAAQPSSTAWYRAPRQQMTTDICVRSRPLKALSGWRTDHTTLVCALVEVSLDHGEVLRWRQ